MLSTSELVRPGASTRAPACASSDSMLRPSIADAGHTLWLITDDPVWPRHFQRELSLSGQRVVLRQMALAGSMSAGLEADCARGAVVIIDMTRAPAREALHWPLLLAPADTARWSAACNGPRWLVMVDRGGALAVVQALRMGAAGALLIDAKPAQWWAAVQGVGRGEMSVPAALAAQVLQTLLLAQPTPVRDPHPPRLASEACRLALSDRESRVLALAAEGLDYEHAGQALGLSRHTVITYARRAMKKLGARSLPQAINLAAKSGVRLEAAAAPRSSGKTESAITADPIAAEMRHSNEETV